MIKIEIPSSSAEDATANLPSRFLVGAGTAFVIQAAGAGLGYLSQVVLARLLGPAGYGQYTYAIAVVTLVATFGALGFPQASLRFVPQYSVQNSLARLKGFVNAAVISVAVASLCAAALGFAIVRLVQSTKDVSAEPSLLSIGVWLIPILAGLNLFAELHRARGAIFLAYAPIRIGRPLIAIGLAYALAFAQTLSAASVLVGLLAGLSLVLGAQVAAFVANHSRRVRRIVPDYEWKCWFRVAFSLAFIAGLSIVLTQTDILMIGVLLQKTDVGVYNVAARTAALVGFLLTAAATIQAPTISALFHDGRRRELQRFLRWSVWIIFVPSLAIVGIVLVAAPSILRVFGAEFVQPGRPIVAVLVVGLLFHVACGPIGYLHVLTGRHRNTMLAYAVGASCNFVLNAVLIPRHGLIGAAVATSASLALWNVILVYLARRTLDLDSSVMSAFKRG